MLGTDKATRGTRLSDLDSCSVTSKRNASGVDTARIITEYHENGFHRGGLARK